MTSALRHPVALLWLAVLAIAAFHQPALAQAGPELDPRIEKLLAQISQERLDAILRTLQTFETRNTLSSTDSPTKGIGAARTWILGEMKKSSTRLQVSFDTYQIPRGGRITRDIELSNVVAILPGRSPRRVYVTAHYDTFAAERRSSAATGGATGGAGLPPGGAGAPSSQSSQQPGPTPPPRPTDNPAPGVNDDGSGTALVMELARVFAESGLEFDATLVFAALAGEEQGLIGARQHAQRAAAEKITIDAVLNNDMVGNAESGLGTLDSESVRVFSESPEDSPSRQLARYVQRQAARYVPSHRTRLIARYDRFGRGGDHTPFNQAGFAAVRITESNEHYGRQHTTADTIESVSMPYLVKNVKVNAAALASLALAPASPAVVEKGRPLLGRGPSGYDAQLRWAASPGAVGYRIFWREAWAPDWEHELNVGSVTEFLLPGMSIDDYVFGVAAVGANGHESLVSAYVNPARQ